MTTLELLQKTRAAMGSIAAAGAEKKNALLLAMADSLEAHCAEILAANAEDMAAARGRITDVMLDRLKLDENRIAGMANGIRDTVRLPDHTGRVLSEVVRPNGIIIDKWSNNNLPSSRMDGIRMEGIETESLHVTLARLVLWFILPLLLVITADRLWIGSKYYRHYRIMKRLLSQDSVEDAKSKPQADNMPNTESK